MKSFLKHFVIVFSLFISVSSFSQQLDTINPIVQIEKRANVQRGIFTGKFEFYVGKIVDNQRVIHYVKIRYSRLVSVGSEIHTESYEGMIFQDEFDTFLTIMDKLRKKQALVMQYPKAYNVSYYYVFSDGTKLGISRYNGNFSWDLFLENVHIHIRKPIAFEKLMKNSMDEAMKL